MRAVGYHNIHYKADLRLASCKLRVSCAAFFPAILSHFSRIWQLPYFVGKACAEKASA